MSASEIHLHEEILLLALDDDKGSVATGSMWQQAAAGAVVAELMLSGRVRATDEKEPKLEVIDRTPLGDPLIDEFLAEMVAAKKAKKGSDWVQELGGRGDLEKRIAAGLVRKGVLKEEHGKVLWIFDVTKYPERDGRAEKAVRERLKHAIFTASNDVDARTIVLVALTDAAGILPVIFDGKRLKERKKRIEAITDGSAAGGMAREAVQAVEMALMVAVFMPLMITTIITPSSS